MKKILLFVIGLVVIIVGAAIAIPFLFEDKIYQKAKELANENLNATVDFKSVDISIIKSFPKLNIELNELSIVGKGSFNKDTLAKIPSLVGQVNISFLWNEDDINVEGITIERPIVNLLVNKDNLANWDIVKSDTESSSQEETENQSESNTSKALAIDRFKIRDMRFQYHSIPDKTLITFNDADLELKGALAKERSLLKIEYSCKNLLTKIDQSTYISGLPLEVDMQLDANTKEQIYTLIDNKIKIQDLALNAKGFVQLLKDSYKMDLSFSLPSSKFKQILGIVPEEYKKDLKGVDTKGKLTLNGSLKGIYKEDSYPAMNIQLGANDGYIKYPDLTQAIKNINVGMNITKPQGNLDLIVIDLPKVHAEVEDIAIDGFAKLTTPMSDMGIDMGIKGNLDFDKIKNAIPIEGTQIKGLIKADIRAKGKYSAIEKERYDQFNIQGQVDLKQFLLNSKEYRYPVSIPNAKMDISSKQLTLNETKVIVGKSDFNISGNLTNYIHYMLRDEMIKGSLVSKSNFIDLNELMNIVVEEQDNNTTNTTTTQVEGNTSQKESDPVELPKNINLSFTAQAKDIIFQRLPIKNVNGKLAIQNQNIVLQSLSGETLEGKIITKGTVALQNPKNPNFNFNLNLQKIDIPKSYQAFGPVKSYMPIAKNSAGKLSSVLQLNGKLNANYSPIYESLNGDGVLSGAQLKIEGSDAFKSIGQFFKDGKFNKIDIEDFDAHFTIENGSILVNPFTTKISGFEAEIAGKQGVQGVLDYDIALKVKKEDLKPNLTSFMSKIPGVDTLNELDVDLKVTGDIHKPQVKIDLSKAKKQVEQELKKRGKEEINKAAKKLGKEILNLFN